MYGLIITVAILTSLILAEKEVEKNGLNKDLFWQTSFWTILLGITGARAYHVIDYWEIYSKDLISILYIWHGGLGIYGALLFGAVTLTLLLKRRDQNIREWLDIFAKVLPLGQGIGRWGNYFNNEHMPYAIYESIANFGLFFILTKLGKRNLKPGLIFTSYLIGYASIRFLLEPLRDNPWTIANLNVAQVVSILLLLTAGALILKWEKD
jgi:phosphatidylglycerol:prolipoprotein diacylglycerol transferase